MLSGTERGKHNSVGEGKALALVMHKQIRWRVLIVCFFMLISVAPILKLNHLSEVAGAFKDTQASHS